MFETVKVVAVKVAEAALVATFAFGIWMAVTGLIPVLAASGLGFGAAALLVVPAALLGKGLIWAAGSGPHTWADAIGTAQHEESEDEEPCSVL